MQTPGDVFLPNIFFLFFPLLRHVFSTFEIPVQLLCTLGNQQARKESLLNGSRKYSCIDF